MRIALDAMGGDFGPEPNVDGAIAALEANPALTVLLVGDQQQLEELLAKRGFSDNQRLQIVPADSFVRMDEKPTEALRRKPNCSIAVCWRLMGSGEVHAVVSAGHTGAVVAAGLRTRLYLKGVKRPGIAVALPTLRGRSVLMDVGANPTARPEHLYQYAIMGSIYAREVLGIQNPTIGLINIGSEETKGTELYRETHALLSQSRLKDRYVGNVEGRGVYEGTADVLVCEGFVGNDILKVSEGMAEFMLRSVTEAIVRSLDTEREKALAALESLSRSYRAREGGGAPLLGVEGICIICHGASDAVAIANALKVATTLKDRKLNSQIMAELAQ